MDFEQYLEKDILKFLDSKIQKKDTSKIDREEEFGLYMARDYLKELNYALDNDELTKAKKLFDELKRTYSKLPKTSYERKKIYAVMEKMYAKIQNYVQIKEGRIEVIKQGESEIQKNLEEKFATLGEFKQSKQQSVDADMTKLEMDAPKDNASVPIESKDDDAPKTEIKETEEKKTEPVEQNITGSSISDEIEEKPEEPVEETKEEEPHAEITPPPTKQPLKYVVKDYDDEYNDKDIEEIEEEIIEGSSNLEKLRMHAIEKLLEEKIAKQVSIELDKRLSVETYEPSVTPRAAPNAVSQIYMPEYEEESEPIDRADSKKKKIRMDRVFYQDNRSQDVKFPEIRERHEHKDANFSNEDLRVVYEQAIYYMFDNQYEEAAKLFKKIINNRPMNKAARIRLQECIENHPELAEEYSDVYNSVLYTPGRPEKRPENVSGYTNNNNNNMGEGIEKLEDAMKKINALSEGPQDLDADPEGDGGFDAKKMYDKAIYAMFQNNYKDAAEIFKNILSVKPGYKAARIRLKECLEEIGDA